MPTDSATFVGKYLRAIDGFNHGDLRNFAELLSDDCTFDGTAGHVGSSREQIIQALQQGLDSGWLSHNPIGTVAAGEFLVTVYENRYTDGSRVIAAGCVRFDDDGKVTEIRSVDPR